MTQSVFQEGARNRKARKRAHDWVSPGTEPLPTIKTAMFSPNKRHLRI
jgi:hypothetical protein